MSNLEKLTSFEKIIRYGVYGIVLEQGNILLTQKKAGPYQGLWGLPGGSIEFGEAPEETLKRELLEESCLAIAQLEFFNIVTATGEYNKNGQSYGFYQVGLTYRILEWSKQTNSLPEEENRWFSLDTVSHQELTPFASKTILAIEKKKIWRPNNWVRGKAIALAKHEDKLLVFEVLDDKGQLKGWCPLGGGIEFGEKAEEALKREIKEELGCELQIMGTPHICENIFEHHGLTGHEIIFAFPVIFENKEIYTTKRFQIHENKGSSHWVEWIPIKILKKARRPCSLQY